MVGNKYFKKFFNKNVKENYRFILKSDDDSNNYYFNYYHVSNGIYCLKDYIDYMKEDENPPKKGFKDYFLSYLKYNRLSYASIDNYIDYLKVLNTNYLVTNNYILTSNILDNGSIITNDSLCEKNQDFKRSTSITLFDADKKQMFAKISSSMSDLDITPKIPTVYYENTKIDDIVCKM